jgi:hypothetical protein
VLLYPSGIDLSTATRDYLAEIIDEHRAAIGCRYRRLDCVQQATLVLAHLRNGDTYARLAAGFGIGIATVCRYVRETVDLLAARAPSLDAAVARLAESGHNYGLLDGSVIRIDRVHEQRPYYCVKHHHHGITFQGLSDPHGNLLWISDGLPGSVYDLTAARHHGILDACRAAGLLLLADRGYIGAGPGVLVPYRSWKKPLGPAYKAANNAHSALRCHVERGFAALKTWRVLTRVRAGTERVTAYARAILHLNHID